MALERRTNTAVFYQSFNILRYKYRRIVIIFGNKSSDAWLENSVISSSVLPESPCVSMYGKMLIKHLKLEQEAGGEGEESQLQHKKQD